MTMRRLVAFVIILIFSVGVMGVRALDPVADLQKQIDELTHLRELSAQATAPLEKELAGLQKKMAGIGRELKAADEETEKLGESIEAREEDLSSHYALLSARVKSHYKSSRMVSPLLIFLASSSASDVARQLSYRMAVADQDKGVILGITTDLVGLEDDKKKLDERKKTLASLRVQFEKEAKFFEKEIAGAKNYQSQLSGQIAALSSQQQSILGARSGNFTSSVGDVPISKIPCSGPPGSPSFCNPGGGYFAGFSFGGWTHRKGMSQYGAKGRAEAGQSAGEIINAYYGTAPVSRDTGGAISVTGYGMLDFEGYYLMGIAEMPSSWHPEAMKAQAIAARSYAYGYKSQGKTICTTQSCQVFSQSKANNPPAEWRAAVEATRGQVIEGVTAYYSSTAGGYLTYPRGYWDTTDSQGGSGFASRAWESKAGSPWFYSSWYTQTFNSGSATCGRGHPWLSQAEMADILNARLVLDNGSDERILPVTINSCPIGGSGGNPYSVDELTAKANSLGGAYTSVSGVSVSYSNEGQTAEVTFSTNKGSVTISGAKFKEAFNLRAPGYISILSPLFNIEKT